MTCGKLDVDESCLIIKSEINKDINFWYQSLECEKCPLQLKESVSPYKWKKFVVKFAALGSTWEVLDSHNSSICKDSMYVGENAINYLKVNESGCFVENVQKAEEAYVPILVAVAIYILLAAFWIAGKYLKRKGILNSLFHRNSLDVSFDLTAAYSSSSVAEEKKASPKRLRSLDTVRGISIVVMIFVNYGGGGYEFFDHSIWNGLSVADLVFPWFIWMMGMSMAFSLRSQLRQKISKKKIFWKILKRSVILFALGIMLNTYCSGSKGIDLSKLRIPGVLQRFGICYLIVATVHLFYASADGIETASHFQDLSPYGGEWLIMCSFLTLHILITFLVAEPQCPRGYLGPGGLHDGAKHFNCTGGAAGFIDRLLLQESHLYQHPSSKPIYQFTLPHDPEGILGFLTSIFLVFLGLQAGKILLCYKDWKNRVTRWMTWGLTLGILAGILCLFSKNDGYIPVNKNLWSVSFIFATGSLAFILLSICYLMIDVQNWWTGAPFYYAGMNSILLYVGHSLTHTMFPWRWQMESNHTNELFLSLWGTSLWVLIAIWMYKIKVFVTV
ncbi:heparan-alpha-glucosaminide N-acetyltransferase-like isoform X1 [Uloborus diversus]|uniref:heparan-alpha-glucosaminide N-acetyltransferase-like isoform X1 n=1 Tax=Uloborus diversus TaxID=327109 RepID=UPI00240A76AF|nr:heparan-alpha-glucosaminide N-acetyltransferase-like isoform X1 [Uloborus diversus]